MAGWPQQKLRRIRCKFPCKAKEVGFHAEAEKTIQARHRARLSAARFVAKLRRLADCIEQGARFRIQVGGERVSVPPDAVINIEHEREEDGEEIEFQLKWRIKA